MQDLTVRLKKVNKRREQLAIYTVLVKIFWWPVGCRHNRDTGRKQVLEQPRQDHGVRNLADLKLVKAQQTGLCCKLLGHGRDRVTNIGSGASPGQPRMNLTHKFVEVHPSGRHGRNGKQFVH